VSAVAAQQGAERTSRLASAAPAVTVERLSKRFKLPHHHYSTFKERALHPFASRTFDTLHALDDVSVDIAQGEFFGIVGRNGSGKSTLLKCLAGIYEADDGHTIIDGRLSPFIELGVGFNPDLTARDNVIINAIMLGLTRREARERFDEIIAFAELEEFLDLKLKNYSSGMSVRLAFSVAIQVDAEVLLVDEVLAVGDAAFQQKCFDEFHRLRDEKKTILFVTHDMPSVNRFCDRAMLLERGDMMLLGDPDEITDQYIKVNFPQATLEAAVAEEGRADQTAVIVEAWFEEERGDRHEYLPHGRPCSFRALVVFNREVEDPSFSVMLKDEEGSNIFGTSTIWKDEDTGRFMPGDQAVFGVSFENLLSAGRYYATVQIAQRGGGQVVHDKREKSATMVTTAVRNTGAVVDLPHDVEVRRPVRGPRPTPEPAGEARA
jgi:ABC-type polysaccharide/polyol phosphate transport system ATPase subunit